MKKMRFIYIICLIIMMFVPGKISEAQTPSVNDMAGYLSEEQVNELIIRFEDIKLEYNFDVVFVSEDEMSGSSAQATADDIFDYQGYGIGEDDNGILFYICKSTRDYHFSTHGSGEEIFSKGRIEELKEAVVKHLKNDEYYEACVAYADLTEKYLANPKGPVLLSFLKMSGIVLLVALVLAFIFTFSKVRQMNTVEKQKTANNYISNEGMNITNSQDIYLYSNVIKIPKPKNNSSGSHVSSSGRSHGGGGGKF